MNPILQLLQRLFGQQQQGQPTQYNWQQPDFEEASAQSRFTKTPISIRRVEFPPREEQVAGDYGSTKTPPYTTNVYVSSRATPKDLQQVLHHEDVHAALDPARTGYDYGNPVNLDPRITNLYENASRAGVNADEMPAYLSTYNPREIPGISPQDVQQWNQKFQQTLPNPIMQLLQRIIASHQASQQGQ